MFFSYRKKCHLLSVGFSVLNLLSNLSVAMLCSVIYFPAAAAAIYTCFKCYMWMDKQIDFPSVDTPSMELSALLPFELTQYLLQHFLMYVTGHPLNSTESASFQFFASLMMMFAVVMSVQLITRLIHYCDDRFGLIDRSKWWAEKANSEETYVRVEKENLIHYLKKNKKQLNTESQQNSVAPPRKQRRL